MVNINTAAVLIMTFLSAAIAGILAYSQGIFHWGYWMWSFRTSFELFNSPFIKSNESKEELTKRIIQKKLLLPYQKAFPGYVEQRYPNVGFGEQNPSHLYEW